MFDIKKEASALVAKMTLEEKVSQMTHRSAAIPRLGIPAYNWWNEALHGIARAGTATMFPQAIGLAATFDEGFLQTVADAISTEGRAKYHASQEEGDRDIYKGLTFWSPNINIFRDPRWGRGHETYGEDPFLTARLGVAFIRGLQGPDRYSLKAAACAKHYAVHSGPESERHSFNAICDSYDLWNTYLPHFEAAVKEAEVEAVMGAYNRTLDEPCCGSKLLLVDILREKWGFDGHVVSDCWAIKDFHEHHKVTNSASESVALAITHGCDVNCGNLYEMTVQVVQEGLLTEEQIDTAVTRLMIARMRLGLLGAPENKAYTSIPYEAVDCPAHRDLNLEAARRGLVLLKNDGVLPLDASKIKTLGVIGPNADSRRALEGNYEGRSSEHVTPLVGLRALTEPLGIRILYSEGSHIIREKVGGLAMTGDRYAEARSVAKRCDAVVLCLGLDADIEGEESDVGSFSDGGDKRSLDLPDPQQKLLRMVVEAAGDKPVIVVNITGSAMALGWADEHAAAVIQAFYPGGRGGTAIAEAIFGSFSPEGKLPVTFYRSDADLPDFRDYNMANRTYRYFSGEPLYPFGFGLGYGKFMIDNVEANRDMVTATVCNTGTIRARETVQVYISTPGQKELRSLCGLCKVQIEPGGTKEVQIKLNDAAFSRYDENGDLYLIPGEHTLHVGFCQPDSRSVALYGQQPVGVKVII